MWILGLKGLIKMNYNPVLQLCHNRIRAPLVIAL